MWLQCSSEKLLGSSVHTAFSFPFLYLLIQFFKFEERKYTSKSQNYTKIYIWRIVTPSYVSSTPFHSPSPTPCRYPTSLFSSSIFLFAKISRHTYICLGFFPLILYRKDSILCVLFLKFGFFHLIESSGNTVLVCKGCSHSFFYSCIVLHCVGTPVLSSIWITR